jgi:hypothetical protein
MLFRFPREGGGLGFFALRRLSEKRLGPRFRGESKKGCVRAVESSHAHLAHPSSGPIIFSGRMILSNCASLT